MRNKQSIINMLFILITFITIFARSFPVNSTERMILTIISIILAIPHITIIVKDKMYNNKLNLFTAILAVFQIMNVLYYSYILKK
ncbi:hypothetical protein BD780_000534 [Clostridium tetanomorphum]|uniref:Uncharacterized protein n=1 Tax=Clostridium tetanomorphum TaxID=1553 RepID=A0A923E7B1_CLOTT|nr:hypothetical protein [Clostridium tetanomorphum]KAJ49508.1 hypothetical protein CTM_22751 [Clostridium tetanomorphum DSM 665]KAJ49660.1 hypothetical protein CTM_21913 [Clostridium tetanomorphum DSM 665]MBC2397738.1 hypothetical protein [Clostridium tetanomorphum]MBP1865093.1 hypothetical protein [Clostridium tetanomorphum]NRS83309.1 hypothetical protein [Clostridium tetanomorphum]